MFLKASKPIEVPELHAGDIGAIAKLASVQTGDTPCNKGQPGALSGKLAISTPYTLQEIQRSKAKGEEDKIAQALAKMMQEDLTLKCSQ